MILAKIMIKWRTAVCEAQGSPKGPKLMIKGIKEAQGRLREAQGTEKALKGTTSVLEAGFTPTGERETLRQHCSENCGRSTFL